MNTKYAMAACASLLLTLPAAAFAANSGLSYNYLGGQLGYTDIDPDRGGSTDGLALGIDGSAALLRSANLIGGYNHSFLDDADLDLLSLGGGLHTQLDLDAAFRLDAFGNVTYEHLEISPDRGRDTDEDGVGVRGGLRAKFEPNFEANGSIGYVDYGSIDGPVFKFGGLYNLPSNQNLALSLSFEHYDFDQVEVDQLLAGVRLYID